MKRGLLFASVASVFTAAAAQASVVPSVATRAITGVEVTDGAPTGATVYEFFLDSTADILSINDVAINVTGGTIYQNGLGEDDAAPNPAFVTLFPALGVDSYITTPGGTTILGGSVSTTAWSGTWGDTDNNGAQSGFKFAQFTLTDGATGTYFFDLAYAGTEGPEEVNFSGSFEVPEPASAVLLGLGAVAMTVRRRRV